VLFVLYVLQHITRLDPVLMGHLDGCQDRSEKATVKQFGLQISDVQTDGHCGNHKLVFAPVEGMP
jgi:hypothetical protein